MNNEAYPQQVRNQKGVNITPLDAQQLGQLTTGMVLGVQACHGAAVRGGWWTDLVTGLPKDRNKGECIALIHSELSEALEGERKNLMDDHLTNRKMAEVEMADAVIRIFDYCGAHGYDIAGAMVEKLAYNAVRADHKIENRQKDDGKKI